MPVDHKRLPVPEKSQTPYALAKDLSEPEELVDQNGKRHDARTPDQVRPLFLRVGVVSQAKGSAYIEMDKTKVICAVYGPREVTRREDFSLHGQLYCEFKYATFSCRIRRGHQMDSEERDISAILTQALSPAVMLEKFPKARMDVFVTVLQDDGSALAAAMTCASVALANAGLEMYDLVVGCSLRWREKDTLLDPCKTEEYYSKVGDKSKPNGGMTLGFMPSLHQVAALVQRGTMTVQTTSEGTNLLIEACQKIFPVLQQCLVRALRDRRPSSES